MFAWIDWICLKSLSKHSIGMGLSTAVNRLKDSEAKSKVIILLTDGKEYISPDFVSKSSGYDTSIHEELKSDCVFDYMENRYTDGCTEGCTEGSTEGSTEVSN